MRSADSPRAILHHKISIDSKTSDPRDMRPTFDLMQMDAVLWLRTLRDESVDLIVTDPPYESLEKHRAIGTTTRLKHSKSSSNDWFSIFPNSRFAELFAELHRVLRRDAHCYVFCDPETMFVIKPVAEAAGFKFWKPIIWDKQRIGMGYHYRARYECVLFFEKGKRRLNDLGIADIIAAPRVTNGYPTEKPCAVAEVLIGQSTRAGELVIDPFVGSGAFGVAALTCERSFAGADTSSHAIQIATERLKSMRKVSRRELQAGSRKTLDEPVSLISSKMCRPRNIAT
jgi:site-specific DNA-methyltransferase (adenine-specific)